MLKPRDSNKKTNGETKRQVETRSGNTSLILHAVSGEIFQPPQSTTDGRVSTQTISVVIPVYNGANHIAEAIQSALDQTVLPDEIIVVDDGSTDDTLSVLAQFGSTIRIIRQKNKGNAAARNTGVLTARGTWIAVLDADDVWEPQKLETQLKHTSDADIIYTNVRNFGEAGYVSEITFGQNEMPSGEVLTELLRDNFIAHSSVLMRRSIVESVGGYDESLLACCDWDLWLRLAMRGARVRAVEEPLTRYRWRPDSTSKKFRLSCRNRLRVLKKAFSTLPATRENKKLHRKCNAATWRTSAWFVKSVDEWQAFRWYVRSLLCEPTRKRTWLEILRIAAHKLGLSRSRFGIGPRRRTSAPKPEPVTTQT